MRDGYTRKLAAAGPEKPGGFLERFRAAIVIVEGAGEGTEFELTQPQHTLGRGPGVDFEFADRAMSREHAAIEVVDEGMRIRDLASSNGVWVNDGQVLASELKHGDRIRIGEHTLQYVLEERTRSPRTYLLPES